jgi:hypothetical protein
MRTTRFNLAAPPALTSGACLDRASDLTAQTSRREVRRDVWYRGTFA